MATTAQALHPIYLPLWSVTSLCAHCSQGGEPAQRWNVLEHTACWGRPPWSQLWGQVLWGCPGDILSTPPPHYLSFGKPAPRCHPASGPLRFRAGSCALCPAWLEPGPGSCGLLQACDQAVAGGSAWGLMDQFLIPAPQYARRQTACASVPRVWRFAESCSEPPAPPNPKSRHFCWVVSQWWLLLPGAGALKRPGAWPPSLGRQGPADPRLIDACAPDL